MWAFVDDTELKERRLIRYTKRTWNELLKKSKLSRGRFQTRLNELIKMGSIEGKVTVDDRNRQLTLYEYVHPPVIMVGNTRHALRLTIAVDKKKRKRIAKAEEGEIVRRTYPRALTKGPRFIKTEEGEISRKDVAEEEMKRTYFRRKKKAN